MTHCVVFRRSGAFAASFSAHFARSTPVHFPDLRRPTQLEEPRYGISHSQHAAQAALPRDSLKNTAGGVKFSLKNRLSDAKLTGLQSVKFDGREAPRSAITIQLDNGRRDTTGRSEE